MSWDQLLQIVREARATATEDAARPLVDCPRCGKPLTAGPNGEPHCTFDGFTVDA